MNKKVLIVDSSEQGLNLDGPEEALPRGVKFFRLAGRVVDVEPHFVFHTLHLLAGIHGPDDYKRSETAFLEAAKLRGECLPDLEEILTRAVNAQDALVKVGSASKATSKARNEALENLLYRYDLILYHSTNQELPLDLPGLVARTADAGSIPIIYYTGGPVERRPNTVELHDKELEVKLPRFLQCFISSEGSNIERFDRCASEIFLGDIAAQELLTSFTAMDILIQGALVMKGYDSDPVDPWWWSSKKGPAEVELNSADRIRKCLIEFDSDPLEWYETCLQDLLSLFPDGQSNDKLNELLAAMANNVAMGMETKLFATSGAVKIDRELLQVAKAIVRGFNNNGKKSPPVADIDLLRSKDTLKLAHEQYVGLWNEACLLRE